MLLAYLQMKKMNFQNKIKGFLKEERGATGVIEIVIILIVVVAIAWLFSSKLSSMFDNLWSQVQQTGFAIK